MANSAIPPESGLNEAPRLGDHLAMDLLNTEALSDGKAIDYWHSGADVLRWLGQHGIASPTASEAVDPAELLAQANALRTLARDLITQFRENRVSESESGKRDTGDIDKLNAYLHRYCSAPHVASDREGKLTLTRVPRCEGIASLLGPVAEAVAQLLVEGDAALVKQCEHPDCILWFYDRTKAHKRRWCSMALCGNRYKAAQFRKRNSGAV